MKISCEDVGGRAIQGRARVPARSEVGPQPEGVFFALGGKRAILAWPFTPSLQNSITQRAGFEHSDSTELAEVLSAVA